MTQILIFVRHSLSAAKLDAPQEAWKLTPEGESRCVQLAEELRPYDPQRIFTSTETKAQSTGELLAQQLNTPWQTAPDLQETARGDDGFFTDKSAFAAVVKQAMQQPEEVIFGSEAFGAARQRFLRQMNTLLQQHPGENLVMVSHGRVLSMVLGMLLKRAPFAIWKELAMPAYAVFAVPARQVVHFAPHLNET